MARCKYCKSTYTAVRKGHIFCSETCRKLNHKAINKKSSDRNKRRRIANKLQKLSSCSFGRYLVKEVRRAGTVEVLHGLTAQSLKDLVALRRKCTASGGYENGEPTGVYELSHVWPVAATAYLGLLTPENLVITPKEFNRKHGQKWPVTGYLGKAIPRDTLQNRWRITEDLETHQLLKLLRAYLGEEFDLWLSGFAISLTQRDTLIKKLKKAGLPKKRLDDLNLQQLKSLADEEDVLFFSLDLSPEARTEVIQGELVRLGLQSEISASLQHLIDDENIFGRGSDREFLGTAEEKQEFESALIKQALLSLHGQPHDLVWRGKSFLEWLPMRPTAVNKKDTSPDFDDDFIL